MSEINGEILKIENAETVYSALATISDLDYIELIKKEDINNVYKALIRINNKINAEINEYFILISNLNGSTEVKKVEKKKSIYKQEIKEEVDENIYDILNDCLKNTIRFAITEKLNSLNECMEMDASEFLDFIYYYMFKNKEEKNNVNNNIDKNNTSKYKIL